MRGLIGKKGYLLSSSRPYKVPDRHDHLHGALPPGRDGGAKAASVRAPQGGRKTGRPPPGAPGDPAQADLGSLRPGKPAAGAGFDGVDPMGHLPGVEIRSQNPAKQKNEIGEDAAAASEAHAFRTLRRAEPDKKPWRIP